MGYLHRSAILLALTASITAGAASAQVAPTTSQCLGDIEAPFGEVGVTDLQVVLTYMGMKGKKLRSIPQAVAADLNLDQIINGHDLATVLSLYGPCPAPCASVLDGDGVVNSADLTVLLSGTPSGTDMARLLSSWGKCEAYAPPTKKSVRTHFLLRKK